MNKNEEITNLSAEIVNDITSARTPLHIILLKCSGLASILDMPKSSLIYIKQAEYAEANAFYLESYRDSVEAARDPDVSLSSANPNEYVRGVYGTNIHSNAGERISLRQSVAQTAKFLAAYRAGAYKFARNINTKWSFGNIAETVFEKKRKQSEPVLKEVFPDINQRLNSIEQNLRSENDEDWKNAVTSCRTLLTDVADVLSPPTSPEDKGKYINRLKTYVSPASKSKMSTKDKLINNVLDEVKSRIEFTVDITQGSAHQVRPKKSEAEDVVLYTYLIIADLMQIYASRKDQTQVEPTENPEK